MALDALSNINVLHTDIKPDNVMFVNSQDQPLRIKLIDFGLAISRSRVNPGMDLQPTGYRYLCFAWPTYWLSKQVEKPPIFCICLIKKKEKRTVCVPRALCPQGPQDPQI